MGEDKRFAVVAIPLNRPDIINFLLPPSRKPKGARLEIVGQRPTIKAETAWIKKLQESPEPSPDQFLKIDDPIYNITSTYTDRLVPIEFLAEPNFLSRNLGGWTSIFFAVAALPRHSKNDPLLNELEIIVDYGPKIRYFGADQEQVAQRLELEMECDWQEFLSSLVHVYHSRPGLQEGIDFIKRTTAYAELLSNDLKSGNYLGNKTTPPIPELLLYDELLSQMRRLELARRRFLFAGKTWLALQISNWQNTWRQQTGMSMIVKGEYIAGRHRGSLVLIAPQLGIVIKQPAPEPFHEIKLNARTEKNQKENWPAQSKDGSLVTSRGRVRLVLEEGIISRIHDVFNHPMTFSTVLGFTVEDYVHGTTVQDFVLADSNRLTAELYEVFVLHQQTCELLDIENGDWHSANFLIREGDNEIVHVDWGAARPLQAQEKSPEGYQERLNQVQNIAYSFHDQSLAEKVKRLHNDLISDKERLSNIKERARKLIR